VDALSRKFLRDILLAVHPLLHRSRGSVAESHAHHPHEPDMNPTFWDLRDSAPSSPLGLHWGGDGEK
jgi:hypothetical protein